MFKTGLSDIIKSLPLLLLSVAILVVVAILGYDGKLSSTDAFAIITTLSGVVGVTGIVILTSTTPNLALLSHLVYTLALLVVVTILTIHNVFTSAQLLPLIGLLIGTGGAAAGVNAGVINTTPASADIAAQASSVPDIKPTEPPAA